MTKEGVPDWYQYVEEAMTTPDAPICPTCGGTKDKRKNIVANDGWPCTDPFHTSQPYSTEDALQMWRDYILPDGDHLPMDLLDYLAALTSEVERLNEAALDAGQAIREAQAELVRLRKVVEAAKTWDEAWQKHIQSPSMYGNALHLAEARLHATLSTTEEMNNEQH